MFLICLSLLQCYHQSQTCWWTMLPKCLKCLFSLWTKQLNISNLTFLVGKRGGEKSEATVSCTCFHLQYSVVISSFLVFLASIPGDCNHLDFLISASVYRWFLCSLAVISQQQHSHSRNGCHWYVYGAGHFAHLGSHVAVQGLKWCQVEASHFLAAQT